MVITDFILEKRLLSAVNVGKSLSKDSSSPHIGKSTLEKSLMNARNVVNLSPEVATWLNISKVTLKKGLYKYCKYGWQWCQRSLRWWQSGQNLWSKWTLSRAETEAQRWPCHLFYDPRWRDKDLRLNATLPGSGIWRIWWLHSSPTLRPPGLRTERTLSILTLLLPLPAPMSRAYIPTHADGQDYLFSENQHWWLCYGWLHSFTQPNQCCDSIPVIAILERRAVQLRELEGPPPEELTTARPFWVVTLHVSTGFSFAPQSRDSSSCILTMSCAHWQLHHHKGIQPPFPVCTSPTNTLPLGKFNSAKLGTLDWLFGISPDLTLASPLCSDCFPKSCSSSLHTHLKMSLLPCFVVDLLTVLGCVRDTEGLRMSSVALTWCSL